MVQLIPEQQRQLRDMGFAIATLGPGLPNELPHWRWRDTVRLLRRPHGARRRVWHARRNIEMLPGVLLRDVLRAPVALVFTSASQREHTAYTRWLIGRMDHVVATSDKGAAYLERPATVVRHGIDTLRFAPPANAATLRRELGLLPGRRYVGCFGRIRERKGTGNFVDAMLRILPARPEWHAIVAGRATAAHAGFEQSLVRRVSEAGLSDRFHFVGERTDIHRWYGVLDLFVAPQRWEGFGMTPLEAMACGVPVVATDVGAFSELLSPETGTIVAAEDTAAMADAVASWMDDDDRRIRAGIAARVRVENEFPLSGEARALNVIYVKLIRPDGTAASTGRQDPA